MATRRRKNGQFAKKSKGGKRFEKGLIPWNKGLKEIHLSPESEFKEGDRIGSLHPKWKQGIQTMKKDGIYLYVEPYKRIRRSRKNYEDTYGPIPKGFIIYHKDGDLFNDNPTNLECITRAELLKRNLNNR